MTTTSGTTTEKPAPGTGHIGQTFLVGDLVYIRAIETDDKDYATWWRQVPFPVSPHRAETIIKEDLIKGDTRVYTIVRKTDDVPVGALWVDYGTIGVAVSTTTGRVFGSEATPWIAEALTMAIPWLIEEQHRPRADVYLTSGQPELIAAVEAVGGRETGRFREQRVIEGQRVDTVVLQVLNSRWLERLGDPANDEIERAGSGEVRPVPAKVVLDGDPPANAVLVGKRVYLRPFEEKDGKALAEYSRKEQETWHDTGRRMYSATGISEWHKKLEKGEHPRWIRFAVCLREDDRLIGAVGLDGIDRLHRFAETESEFYAPELRGQGYGHEAKHLLLEFAFNRLNLHSLQSMVLSFNTRSAAALRKQGYREAGRQHWALSRSGRFIGFILFDILADEWRTLPREA
jgi:RimJ/RimL family protein N-acetyltransferase